MRHITLLDKNNYKDIIHDFINNNFLILIIKNFYEKETCKQLPSICHLFAKSNKHFLGNVFYDTFFSGRRSSIKGKN